MKLNKLHQYTTNELLLRESLDELDLSAKEELDGIDDLDLEDDLDPIESDMDNVQKPERPDSNNKQEYNLSQVSAQLDGMVEHWFKLAQNVDSDQKEDFLKLGDRLSEIAELLNSEFVNGW